MNLCKQLNKQLVLPQILFNFMLNALLKNNHSVVLRTLWIALRIAFNNNLDLHTRWPPHIQSYLSNGPNTCNHHPISSLETWTQSPSNSPSHPMKTYWLPLLRCSVLLGSRQLVFHSLIYKSKWLDTLIFCHQAKGTRRYIKSILINDSLVCGSWQSNSKAFCTSRKVCIVIAFNIQD